MEEKLKPKNILTDQELKEVVRRLRGLRFPHPQSLAEAYWVGGLRQDAEHFSAERVYREIELRNLKTTLHTAGVRNEAILGKLELAAQFVEEYGLE